MPTEKNPLVGTIRPWAGAWAPEGWLLCNGAQYLSADYPNLSNLLGSTYGGGQTNFAVPNMNGRFPMGCYVDHVGPEFRDIAGVGGYETVKLDTTTLAPHTHTATVTPAAEQTIPAPDVSVSATLQASSGAGNTANPGGNYFANAKSPSYSYIAGNFAGYSSSVVDAPSLVYGVNSPVELTLPDPGATVTNGNAGVGQAMNLMPPYTTINFIICAIGDFPTQ